MPGADASDADATAAAVRCLPAGARRDAADFLSPPWSRCPVSYASAVSACPELLCPVLACRR